MEAQAVGNVTMQTVERGWMQMTVRGTVNQADAGAIMAYAAGCRAELDPGEVLLCMVMAGDMRGIEREARYALTTGREAKIWDRIAVVGAPFEVEVVLESMILGLQTLGEDAAELCFHDSEVVARAWLAQGR